MRDKNTSRYIKFALYILVIVLINIVGITMFARLDLTGNKVYSLSRVSKETVSTLSEPLTINVFFTRNLPAPYNTIERYLKDLLAEYALHSNRYFNYRFFDVTAEGEGGSQQNMENRKLAEDYGIYPIQIQAFEQDEVKFKKAYMGLAIIHGDMVERISTISSTEGLEYNLTMSIRKLNNKISALINLEKPVQVKLYLSPSLRLVAPYMQLNEIDTLADTVKNLVTDLAKTMYGKLSYSFKAPADESEMDELVEKYNLMKLQWPDIDNGRISAGKGVIGLVMEHGDNSTLLPILNVFRVPLFGTQYKLAGPDDLEDMISSSLELLIGINEDIGYLADHGTLETFAMPGSQNTEAISHFSELASKSYRLKDVALAEDGIPEGLGCMIIAGPTEEFSDYELFQIDQALMRGMNLAIFMDSFKEIQMPSQNPYQQQPPQYIPLDTGLEKLLDSYGVRIRRSIVLDENSYKQRLPQQYGGGEQHLYFAPIIQREFINNDIAFMENIKGLIMVKVSPVEIDEVRLKEHNIQAHRLFSSSERSWEMRDNINFNPMYMRPPAIDDEMKSMPLAYSLEGRFASYFTGKPIPERPRQEAEDETQNEGGPSPELPGITGTGDFISTSSGAKIILVSTSEVLKNNVLDAQGASPNAMFVMNILDVLNNRQDIALMRSKILTFNPLTETDAGTKTFIKSLNIIGLPVIVVVIGLLMWVRRHMRKKHIELKFQRQR
ncbi:MAG TPA: ABC transporter permease [Deltaproteobacteria bacterium]|nr:ABC transporter permease [Deltaproteobacteria bacterium]